MAKRRLADERLTRKKDIERLREEVDTGIARLLAAEGAEEGKRKELEASIAEVDEREAKVVQWLAEGKRQSKLLAVLSAQRDI